MSRHISTAINEADFTRRAEKPAQTINGGTKQLFLLFHGWYGNLFLSRYETGDNGIDGKDRGTLSAMVVWQNRLAEFDPEVVRTAAERCETEHPKFPPTLPEFVAICRAVQPRTTTAMQFKIPMSEGLRSSYTARARAEAMSRYRANQQADAGMVKTEGGLAGLHALVAKAVGLAGGDEVAALRRFDAKREAA